MKEKVEGGNKDSSSNNKSSPFWRHLKQLLLVLVSLWVVIIISIQIPAVQSFIVNKITQNLSDKTGTEIHIENFNFQLFNAITLENVYVEDYDSDTLLFAERFKLNFKNPILTYLKDRMFRLDGLTLTNATFNLDRNPEDTLTNLERFLSNFQRRDTFTIRDQQETFVFELELNEIILRATEFKRTDSLYGVYQKYYVHQALLNPQKLDLAHNSYSVRYAAIDSLSIEINNFPGSLPDSLYDSFQKEPARARTSPLSLDINELTLNRGKFELHNYTRSPVRESPEDVLDWDHFTVDDIDLDINDFRFNDWVFTGCLNDFNGHTNSGFEITELRSDSVYVDSTRLEIPGAYLQTPFSNWSLDINMDYQQFADFKSYTDKVDMKINSKEGSIAIEDIITFAPGLSKVRFFNENRNEKIVLNGYVYGTVNDLNGDDIMLKVADASFLEGYFSSRNLADPQSTLLNLEIEDSRTSMRELRKLIPGFAPPKNFNRLGNIRFQGRFDGFYQDFVAYGSMQTDIGQAEMDMRMNLSEEFDKAEYSGQLNLNNFDLQAWTGNPDFGLVNLKAFVSRGEGLTLQDLQASLDATIQDLNYKDYTYKNFNIEGQFQQASFEGYFNIDDPYVDFSFIGSVDLSRELPLIDVDASIDNINFKKINLTEKTYTLSGKFDLEISNYKIDALEAKAFLNDVVLTESDSIAYTLDSLSMVSEYLGEHQKSIEIKSNLIKGQIQGDYNLERIWPTLWAEISDYYPSFSDKLGWEIDSSVYADQNFEAKLEIVKTKNWTRLIDPKLDSLYNTSLDLAWNNEADSFRLDLYTPRLHYGSYNFHDGYIYVRSYEGSSNLVVGADSAIINDRFQLDATTVFADIAKDTLFWTINTANYDSLMDNFNIQGKTFIKDQHWTSSLSNKYLQLFNEKWYISPKNTFQIDSQYLNIEEFSMRNEERRIRLQSLNNEGISINLEGVELSLLNDILAYDKLKYAGKVKASFQKASVFQNSALSGLVRVDSLFINDDDYGFLDLELEAANARSAVKVDGGIIDTNKALTFDGLLFASNQNPQNNDFYDVGVQLKNYPLKILEYFIGENISKTEGVLNGDFVLMGVVDKPILEGEAILTDGAVTINFLGTRIFVDSQYVRTRENEIDVSGAVIQDKYGNTAQLKGGLVHDYFTDLGLDFRLVTDNFLLLNTTVDDESMYYGHCLGSAQVDMFGSINSPNINVVAENNPNTQFYLNTDVSGEEVQAGFFRYEELKDTAQSVDRTLDAPKGVNFFLDLTANESAEVQIIIDENTGDIIKGRGSGKIQFFLNPAGEINMFGNYTISTGEYLFTAQTLINKTFRVSSGSIIRWTGDPFAAIIDIKATYDVVTSPLFFVDDMVVEDPQLISQLEDPTEVILFVNLTGYLYSPELGFDLQFPNLTGTAETVVENKLALLEGNPSEMYDHAGALIVFNSFIPSEAGLGGSISVAAGINTISEFLTNQFSRLFSSLLRSAVEDVGFIEDIDFDVTYDVAVGVEDLQASENFALEGGEFKMRTSARLFERVELDLGGNYGLGGSTLGATETGTYFTGNFAIQYALTRDRRLVLRVYSATDRVLEGRRFRSGVGIRYQQEFDSFSNFFLGLKEAIQRGATVN